MTATLPKTAADFKQALNIQVIAGDTTATLNSKEDADGNDLANGLYGFTIDGDNQYKEYIICTLTGLALSNIYSVSAQGVATAGFGEYHRKGASVEITDWSVLYAILQNMTGQVGFDSLNPLFYDAAPALGSSNQFATVQYVLDHINGGAVSFNAEVVSGMAGETISSGQWVYLKEADGRWYKTDATDTAKSMNVKIGKALGAGTAGNAIANGVFIDGLETAGTYAAFTSYYLSNTPGALATSPGTNSVLVGISDGNSKLPFGLIPPSTRNALVGGGAYGTPSSTNKFATTDYVTSVHKFGGDGSDGALTITSGATNINLGGAAIVKKNYTSISITGTGQLTFSNPHANGTIIILKCQGNVTITSSASPAIDASGMGGAAGTGAAAGAAAAGTAGTDGVAFVGVTHKGLGGAGSGGTAGADGAVMTPVYPTTFYYKSIGASCGAGGGGGGNGGNSGAGTLAAGGDGGRGGAALIIECAGALNFTSIPGISVAGKDGAAGGTATSTRANANGGGGGAAGCCLILYGTLTANSGTIVSTGGAVGAVGTGGSGGVNGGPGGGGANLLAGASGVGAAGWSLVAANTEFF